MRRRSCAIGAAAVLALSLAACGGGGGGDDAGSSETEDVDFDSMSMDELYEASQEAGEDSVMLYTVLSEDDLAVIAEPFEKMYPGIEVQNYEGQGEDAAAKVVEEANAGVHAADTLDTEQNTIYAISQEGLLAEYEPPAAAEFDDQYKHPTFNGFRVQIKPMAYNSDLVSADEAPKDYEDLLDPKWKGKVCAEASEVAVFALMIEDMGEDEALDLWKGLVENDVRFISGQTTLIQSLISGDCTLSVSANIHGIAPEQENGAPVEWVQTDPMYANYGAVGVLKDAPHPYAARLWTNFVLSPEGQQSVADNWRIPANPAVTPREPELADPSTYNVLVAGDDIMERARELNDLYYTTTERPVVAPG
jgi:iron(III) transport system substrate-binding protein